MLDHSVGVYGNVEIFTREKEKVMVMVNTERPALEEAVIGVAPMTFWEEDTYQLIEEDGGETPLYFVGVSEPGVYARRDIRIAGFQLVVPEGFAQQQPPKESPCYLALLRPPTQAEGLVFVYRIGRRVFLAKTGKIVHYVPV